MQSGYMEIQSNNNFALVHLQSAAFFARRCSEFDKADLDVQANNPQVSAYATGAVISSFSFLEAQINQVFLKASRINAGGLRSWLDGLDNEKVKFLGEIWDTKTLKVAESASVLDKYNLALRFLGKQTFENEKGQDPYQSANLLRKLRNALVHTKPEPQQIAPPVAGEMEKRYRNLFPESELFSRTHNAYWPDKCLGYGCAQWSVSTALAFADEFFNRLEIKAQYDHARDSCKTSN